MNIFFFLSQSREPGVELFQHLELVGREIFSTYQPITGGFAACDEFIQFYLQCNCVLILGLLNDKYHQKSNNSGAGVDHELPRNRKIKNGTSDNQTKKHKEE